MSSSEEKVRHFELLIEVGKILSSKLTHSELLTTIIQLSAKIVDAETASLLLVDQATNELYFDVALGLPPDVAAIRLKMGQGIAGTVAEKGESLIINDARRDPRWTSKVDDDSGFVTRSILAAPIMLKGVRIGVVEAINHKGGGFSETDLRIFEAFASQAAIAIDNARLFQSVREEKTKLNTLLDEIHDAALLTDRRGRILVANNAARGFLGEPGASGGLEEAVRGMKLTPPVAEIIASQEHIVEIEAVREAPKMLILAGTATLVRDADSGDDAGRVVVFRDVTEERREEGLKRNFLSLISHKLKTPLASITGYAQLLIQDAKKREAPSFVHNGLATIQSQGQKLIGLVEKLLNYTVLEQLDEEAVMRKDFKILQVMQEAVTGSATALAEHKGEAEIVLGDDLGVIGDPILIRDVLKNLIENGVKFAGGEKPKVILSARTEGDAVEVLVADNGPGIPPEEHEKIFRKFYQIDTSFTGQIEGWGLGLSFVRQVVEAIGGTVRLESKIGSGSTFILRLPAAGGAR